MHYDKTIDRYMHFKTPLWLYLECKFANNIVF